MFTLLSGHDVHQAENVSEQLVFAATKPSRSLAEVAPEIAAPVVRVVDRAIQVWGGAGVTNDLPLAQMYLAARILRLADGPDEVHRILIAKNVVHQYEGGATWDFGN